ncbi:OLC1v1011870C1 [Oldenlandia corymbosa var. corymbosa]|uniref:OLC1v1011870C1 n=1 Tax=Oldenlandia corymbosa var. corymbosa TaxID=529605 RepID=A0AAV1DXP6_OLDCO|nr:OLC1v1011870C1 [Oldenlandia corymbosa var. corymbosa]
MGSTQSAQVPSSSSSDDDDEDDPEEHEEEEEGEHDHDSNLIMNNTHHGGVSDGGPLLKKVLQTQEPEMLPCHSSASPLSPQLSSLGTPRLGPSIKVWDPYNVLAPPPLSSSSSPDVSRLLMDDDPHPPPPISTQVFLISHGECLMNLRPDLISGRSPEAALTPNGKRQARALAVFFKSQGVRFNAVYSSPLDRARATAALLCQELNFSEEQIQSSDALMEMSQGHWEGCHRSEIYTAETLSLMDRLQPDFAAPSGESLRQVEFRMVQFLNGTILALPEKFRADFSPPDSQTEMQVGFPRARGFTNSIHDPNPPSHWTGHGHRMPGLSRKKSGKSRLQVVTTTGDHEADDEMSPRPPPLPLNNHGEPVREMNLVRNNSTCVAVFTHAVPIKCLVTGILGCSAVMSHKICIEDSSVTVLQHSWKMGWQIKRLNDTAHLRLL